MKVRIELTESEIQYAIKEAIKNKFPDLDLYAHQIKLEGSVKFKKRSVRKPMTRIKAFVETSK